MDAVPPEIREQILKNLLTGRKQRPLRSPYSDFLASANVSPTWRESCREIFFELGGHKNFFNNVEGPKVSRGAKILWEADRKKIRSLFDLPCICLTHPSTIMTPNKGKCGRFCSFK